MLDRLKSLIDGKIRSKYLSIEKFDRFFESICFRFFAHKTRHKGRGEGTIIILKLMYLKLLWTDSRILTGGNFSGFLKFYQCFRFVL